jgi:hypothetical protein
MEQANIKFSESMAKKMPRIPEKARPQVVDKAAPIIPQIKKIDKRNAQLENQIASLEKQLKGKEEPIRTVTTIIDDELSQSASLSSEMEVEDDDDEDDDESFLASDEEEEDDDDEEDDDEDNAASVDVGEEASAERRKKRKPEIDMEEKKKRPVKRGRFETQEEVEALIREQEAKIALKERRAQQDEEEKKLTQLRNLIQLNIKERGEQMEIFAKLEERIHKEVAGLELKERAIAEKAASIASTKTKSSALDSTLDERLQELKRAEEKSEKRQKELDILDQKSEKRQKELDALDQKNEKREKELDFLDKHNEKRQKELEMQQQNVDKRQKELDALASEMDQKEKVYQTKLAELLDRETTIRLQEQELKLQQKQQQQRSVPVVTVNNTPRTFTKDAALEPIILEMISKNTNTLMKPMMKTLVSEQITNNLAYMALHQKSLKTFSQSNSNHSVIIVQQADNGATLLQIIAAKELTQ